MSEKTATQYDRCIDIARERILAENAEKERAEWLSGQKDGQKAAARIWFNLLTECWPPERSERYWTAVSDKFNDAWNNCGNNVLLQKLLLMTHEYLGEVLDYDPGS